MDSFFEKITLYDIIGYMLPGSMFVFLAGLQPFYHGWLDHKELCNGGKGYIILCLVVISYVVGVALSELAHILVRKRHGEDRKIKELLQQRGVNLVDLIDRSGVLITEVNNSLSLSECFQIMYSDIQTDSNYKRIHNYASAEVMYKNMFMALSVGEVFWVLEGFFYTMCQGRLSFFAVVVAAAVFALINLYLCRWKRFNQKKMCYTLLWFEKKYRIREPQEKGTTKRSDE